MAASAIIPGAESFSAGGGPAGALVLHGITGSCQSVRGVAEALATAGFTVECPLLPGHGTTVADLQATSWADWSAAAEAAYDELAARCPDGVMVAGLSMGGTLTAWIASRRPDVAGIACINPAVASFGPVRDLLVATIEAGEEVIDKIGHDIADPEAVEISYEHTPLRPLLSLLEAIEELQPDLPNIACPAFIVTSTNDHVVPPFHSDHLAEQVAGPVERMILERSFHVATLDYDRADIEARVVEFAQKCFVGR